MAKSKKVYTTNDEDKELVLKYLNGDSSAFTPLFHKYKNIFFVNATRWFNYKEDEIEDMAMEFLGRMVSSLDKYDPGKALFSTWITNCMRYYMIEYHGRVKNKPVKAKSFEEMGLINNDGDRIEFSIAEESEVLNEIERSAHSRLIREMLKTLGPVETRIFQEHFINGLNQRETAEILELNPDTMWYRVAKIRKKLYKFKKEI